MKQMSLVLFFAFYMHSCKEEVHYQISISIQNEFSDTIKVILYPKEEPFQWMKELTIEPEFNQVLYAREWTNIDILQLMADVFDSIKVHNNSFVTKFSQNSSNNSNFNPYTDTSVWASEIIESDMPTNFTNTHVVTENYYFCIGESNIISK